MNRSVPVSVNNCFVISIRCDIRLASSWRCGIQVRDALNEGMALAYVLPVF